jgi:maltooligosyltrehalose trehalohydrolase
MPVVTFPGQRNWGYDGASLFAPHEAYGGPAGLRQLVDDCHAHGLALFLDVVYNHLGPEGNYLQDFGPYFTDRYQTPWGAALNFDGPDSDEVRRFFVDNALHWLTDYHVDGLRLDAVHALVDTSVPHLLAELSTTVSALSADLGRPLTLIAESDLNDPVMITPVASGGYGMDAQWDDDVHHALHAMLTGERQGYYVDFGSLAVFAKVWTSAFEHDGSYSTFREKVHGHPVDRDHTPGYRFVAFLQDHDQVGNRAAGDRLPALTSRGLLEVGAVLLLTAPFTPMLWMGEEWAASTPWPFFTSHPEPHLAAVTGPGRIEEFRQHGWDASGMVDPQDPRAYRSAVLDWHEADSPGHRDLLDLYRRLIALRAAEPDLRDPNLAAVRVDFDEDARWLVVHRGAFRVVANLADQPRTLDVDGEIGDVVLATGEASRGPGGLTVGAESAAILSAE